MTVWMKFVMSWDGVWGVRVWLAQESCQECLERVDAWVWVAVSEVCVQMNAWAWLAEVPCPKLNKWKFLKVTQFYNPLLFQCSKTTTNLRALSRGEDYHHGQVIVGASPPYTDLGATPLNSLNLTLPLPPCCVASCRSASASASASRLYDTPPPCSLVLS